MTDRELLQMALDTLRHLCLHSRAVKGYDGEQVQAGIDALKTRLAQPESEPVAWITGGGKGELWWHQSEKFDTEGNLIGKNPDDIPLYTAPPKKEWVDLTEEEIEDLTSVMFEEPSNEEVIDFASRVQAKLKEKNSD